MNRIAHETRQHERLVAGLLRYGTVLASSVIAAGFVWALGGGRLGPLSPAGVTTAGIALFILLPVMRVALMLVLFLREHDYRFGLIAALVLIIIALGFLAGLA